MHPKVLALPGREFIFVLVSHFVPVAKAAGNTQGLLLLKSTVTVSGLPLPPALPPFGAGKKLGGDNVGN